MISWKRLNESLTPLVGPLCYLFSITPFILCPSAPIFCSVEIIWANHAMVHLMNDAVPRAFANKNVTKPEVPGSTPKLDTLLLLGARPHSFCCPAHSCSVLRYEGWAWSILSWVMSVTPLLGAGHDKISTKHYNTFGPRFKPPSWPLYLFTSYLHSILSGVILDRVDRYL